MTPKKYDEADRRVQRTHKLIIEALIDLTAQKGFSAVTVSDLTEQAGINRATFYRHYTDKFDLLNQYAQEVYALLEAPLAGQRSPAPLPAGDDKSLTLGLRRVLEHIRANGKFYRVMLGENGDPGFSARIREYIQKRIRRTLPAPAPTDSRALELYVAYSSSASVGAVVWWLEHDLPYSSEELANRLRQLEIGNLKAMPG